MLCLMISERALTLKGAYCVHNINSRIGKLVLWNKLES